MEQTVLSINDDKMTTRGELVEYPAELIGGRNLIKESDPIHVWTGEHDVITDKGAFVYMAPPHYLAMYQVEVRAIDDSIVGAEFGWQWSSRIRGKTVILSKEWEKATAFFEDASAIGLRVIGGLGRIELRHIKLEKGNKATPWTPAPEDLGLSYPNWVTEFKPFISENGILAPEFDESGVLSFSINRTTAQEFIENPNL